MKTFLIALCTALCCASTCTAAKEKTPPEWRTWPNGDRFSIIFGAFNAALDTKISVDSSDGLIGTELDLESDLGLEDSKLTPIAAFKWRMAKKHRIAFSYLRLDRDGSETSNVAIRIGDKLFGADLPIQTNLDIEIFEIDYAYSVFFRRRHNLAIGAGISFQNIKFSVVGSGALDQFELSESVSVPAPLPTLVLGYSFAILDRERHKLLLDINIGWLALSLQNGDDDDEDSNLLDFDGSIWNNSIALNWKPFNHVGFKLGFQQFSVDADVKNNDRSTSLEYVYTGPSLGVEAFW
jgi:hypothetical protein